MPIPIERGCHGLAVRCALGVEHLCPLAGETVAMDQRRLKWGERLGLRLRLGLDDEGWLQDGLDHVGIAGQCQDGAKQRTQQGV
jgi:hypothetical protein